MTQRLFALCLVAAANVIAAIAAPAAAQRVSIVPDRVLLDEAAGDAIDADWLNDAERAALRVFHGVWGENDLLSPELRARAALIEWRLHDAALRHPEVPATLRAEAMLRTGQPDQALKLIGDDDSAAAIRIRAEALEMLGRFTDASRAASAAMDVLEARPIQDPEVLTEAVRALVIRSRIEGQPARDFQAMMDLLGRAHQQLDRFYWPAKIAEADLLSDKDNIQEAVTALHETLNLNPRCSRAWFELGRLAAERFNFDAAALAAEHLWSINPEHPLAVQLLAESRLVQDDPDGALEVLEPLRTRWPAMRRPIALEAAAHAILYDEQETRRLLDRHDELSPDSADAYYRVGRHLSLNRQYDAAAAMLEEAIRREPAWPKPQIELGLMHMQSGHDDRALAVLRDVTQLDPFNKRAINSKFLLKSLTEYDTVETDHFIIRYQPGIDEVLVDMMPKRLERIHQLVSTRFGFEPDRKTIIEVLPNHQRFAVRITGMPWIHTVAACTGPVIAMEVPREGPPRMHLGLFDWPRVLQHEYTHTITLAQTNNRIPHWLTEAAAVEMEPGPRGYDRCRMLAEAHQKGTLFSLDEIKWAFVRPKQPGDRGKAYAQSHWMVQYMIERFGESSLIRLLERYFQGQREQQAIPNALGISREQFFDDFKVWAGEQIESWGLAPQPSLEDLADELRRNDPDLSVELAASRQARLDVIVKTLTRQIGRPDRPRARTLTADLWPPLVRPAVEITRSQLNDWLDQYPDHPDLWELRIRRALQDSNNTVTDELIPWLQRYAELRPVDPFPHKQLARYWLDSDMPSRAIPHLEYLDVREEKTPVYAIELAKLYRRQGNAAKAIEKANRALEINPYHAANRELAAAIAVEANRLDLALTHIKALTLIEPDRPQHRKRLERIELLINRRG